MLADVDEGVVVLGPVLPEDLRVRHGHEGDVLWQIKSFVISEEASSSALYFEAELMHQKHYNSAFQTAYARKGELKNLPVERSKVYAHKQLKTRTHTHTHSHSKRRATHKISAIGEQN